MTEICKKKFLAIALTFLGSGTMLTLFLPPQETLCSSSVEGATLDTNWRPALRGFLMVFGATTAILWCSIRSYEVSSVAVFGSKRRSGVWIVVSNAICWGILFFACQFEGLLI